MACYERPGNRGSDVPGIEKFFDILEEVKKEEQTTIETLFFGYGLRVASYGSRPITHSAQQVTVRQHIKKAHGAAQKAHQWKKVRKSIRGMPWLSEAMKDVISCDKRWGSANMT